MNNLCYNLDVEKQVATKCYKHSVAAPTSRFSGAMLTMPNTSTPSYQLVYAIQSVNLKTVKIGFSTDVNQRLDSLQGGSPDELKVIGCWLGDVTDEKKIHSRFADCRLHREWFRPTDELLSLVAALNQAKASEVPGKLHLPVEGGEVIEIWETCKAAREHVERRRTRRRLLICNFCSKLDIQVQKLIAGPDETYICNECVDVCNQILRDEEDREAIEDPRFSFLIQSAKDYVYSAKSKRHALQLWLKDYCPQGDGVSNLSIKPLPPTGPFELHHNDEAKTVESKTYQEWADSKEGFIAIMLKNSPFDTPALREAEAANVKLREESQARDNEIAVLKEKVRLLEQARKLSWKERLYGETVR
jgi:hypothetical protein